MRNVVKVAQFTSLLSFSLITGGMAPVAEAREGGNLNAHLRGAYAVTTARTCTVSTAGFGPAPFFAIPSPLPPGAAVFRQSAMDAGIITFNGDGTGTVTGRTENMNLTNTAGSFISVSEFASALDYTVNPDGTVDTTTTTNSAQVFPPPPPVGSTFVTTTGQVGRWQIAHGKTMLVSAPAGDPTLETLVFTPPAGAPFTQYRICVRSRTATKLPSDD
jgi:hypothetical protein